MKWDWTKSHLRTWCWWTWKARNFPALGVATVSIPFIARFTGVAPEVQAVVHTHPVYGTVMASMEAELASITHEGSIFVPPPVPRFNLTTSLIRTREQGEALARQLGDHRALLLQNHGVVLAAGSIEEVTMLSIMLEEACKAQLIAMAAGSFRSTPQGEALEKQKTIYSPERSRLVWEYYSRRVPRW
jgi:ribulose-5-phosphate 4-epimerase/fuculose-1-phosphate aldolase